MRNAIPSALYVMRDTRGMVKVGRSRDVEQRCRALSATAGEIEICFQTCIRDDASYVEAEAHRLLGDSRQFGEWFNVSADEARAAIESAVVYVARRKDASRCKSCKPAAIKWPRPEARREQIRHSLKNIKREKIVLRAPEDVVAIIDEMRAGRMCCDRANIVWELIGEALEARGRLMR